VSGGERPFGRDAFGLCVLHRGSDRIDFFTAEIAAVAGMRVESGHRNARTVEPAARIELSVSIMARGTRSLVMRSATSAREI
jgi:hypothetical protein